MGGVQHEFIVVPYTDFLAAGAAIVGATVRWAAVAMWFLLALLLVIFLE